MSCYTNHGIHAPRWLFRRIWGLIICCHVDTGISFTVHNQANVVKWGRLQARDGFQGRTEGDHPPWIRKSMKFYLHFTWFYQFFTWIILFPLYLSYFSSIEFHLLDNFLNSSLVQLGEAFFSSEKTQISSARPPCNCRAIRVIRHTWSRRLKTHYKSMKSKFFSLPTEHTDDNQVKQKFTRQRKIITRGQMPLS